MRRLAALLFSALAAAVVTAAPAPLPRAWVSGWDRPVDPLGGCRFRRSGDRLTLSVPGKGGGSLLNARGLLNCPRLLRGVEGDFVAQVRVGGNLALALGARGYRRAGLLLVDGRDAISVYRSDSGPAEEMHVGRLPSLSGEVARGGGVVRFFLAGPAVARPAYLRLERRGNRLDVAFSLDGKRWAPVPTHGYLSGVLPWKLKVGVFAEATAPGTFKAEFDRFSLSRPTGPR
jgi:hypothetical protein